ncbi:MAG TPA: hypothetical protein VGH27_03420 [Streptosporangiaceae bacterium]|jgi:hypothetical protein
MTRRQRHKLVETRADLILIDALAAQAFADNFEGEMRRGRLRRRLARLRPHPHANRWVGKSLVTLASCDPMTREFDDPRFD